MGRTREEGRSVRRRSIAVWVGLGVVLIVLFTGFVLRQAEQAVQMEAEDRVRTTAELTADLTGERSARFAELAESGARSLSGLPAPRRARLPAADLTRLRTALEAVRDGADGSGAVELTDPLGRVVASTAAAARGIGVDRSGTDWYRGVRTAGRTYLSRADEGPGGAPASTLATPVRSADGALTGYLAATAVGRFQSIADAAGEGTTLTLTDQAGSIVGRTRRTPERLVTKARDPLVVAALAGGSGVRVRVVDGTPTVSGYAAVPRTGWAVLVELPATRAFAAVTRLRLTLLLGAAIVAFLLLWLLPLLALRLGLARERVAVSERFQADLLPTDLPAGVLTHYVASEKRMLLGGDFLDAVRTPDGGLAVLVGDVCGHGPRAAALAARLRASWRTLATAGAPIERLDVLDRLVVSERPDEDLFATVVVAHVDVEGRTLRWALAGHPPLLLAASGRVEVLDAEGRGPALGLVSGVPWPVATRALPERWTLVLYTDGLIEARGQAGGERLEVLGLQALVEAARGERGVSAAALVRAVAALADAGGQGLDDDLAILVVDDGSTGRHGADTEIPAALRG